MVTVFLPFLRFSAGSARKFPRNALLTAVPFFLVFKQPDLGTALVIGVLAVGMLLWNKNSPVLLTMAVSPFLSIVLSRNLYVWIIYLFVLWLLLYFNNNIVRDITVQWKAMGSMVGSWNMLVYGTSMYLMEKMTGDRTVNRFGLTIAVPRGALLEPSLDLLDRVGIDTAQVRGNN